MTFTYDSATGLVLDLSVGGIIPNLGQWGPVDSVAP